MIIYLLAFGIEIPFMNTTVFEGPVAKALGGGDIAWIVGAVVTVPLYIGGAWLARRYSATPTASDEQIASNAAG